MSCPWSSRAVQKPEAINGKQQVDEPQRNPAAYSSHRTLGVEEEEFISTMSLDGASPRSFCLRCAKTIRNV